MTEYTANLELAATNKESRANPEQVALVARNRAARARRKTIWTIINLLAGALMTATAVLLALKIGADIAYWKTRCQMEALK